MSLIEEMRGLGVDVDEALDRVMGDASTYELMLGLFAGTVSESPVKLEDFDSGSLEQLTKTIHMLKGVTGNLSMTPLFTGYQEILELLRAGKAKEAQANFEKLEPVQASMVACIERYQAE